MTRSYINAESCLCAAMITYPRLGVIELHVRITYEASGMDRVHSLGPAFLISSATLSNFSKFLTNSDASLLADISYFLLSDQLFLVLRTSVGTPVHDVGISRLKI
jgi:hypothetical protein